MVYRYQLYGLSISSTTEIRYLTPANADSTIDVTAIFHRQCQRQEQAASDSWEFGYPAFNGLQVGAAETWKKGDRYKIRFRHPHGGLLEFILSANAVDVFISNDVPEIDAVSFLIGPVLTAVCRLRRSTCLHASVMAMHGRALALVGEKGAGKSTTAAMLAKKGVQHIADDVAVLSEMSGQIITQTGYPFMRLTPQVAKLCTYETDNIDKVLSVGDKYYVPANTPGCETAGPNWVPLKHIYVLHPIADKNAANEIIPMEPATALRELNSHASVKYIADKETQKRDFEIYANIARANNVSKIRRANNLARLDSLCDLLIQDFLQ